MLFNLDLLLYFSFSFAGVFITYHLNHTLKQGGVRASASASLIVGLVFYFFPNMFDQELNWGLPLSFIGASFIGMSNTQYFTHIFQMFISALIFTVLNLISAKLFAGFGGKLGLMANVSVVMTIAIFAPLQSFYISDRKSKLNV